MKRRFLKMLPLKKTFCRVFPLLFCGVLLTLAAGCNSFASLPRELEECSKTRGAWLKKADPAAKQAEIYMRTADVTHPTAEMAIKAAACADVDFLVAMHKNGFSGWSDPFIILAGCKTPYVAVVKLLHSWGADLNAKYSDGAAVIHCAAHHGRLETVRYLVEQGVAVNTPDNEGMTPLHWAASEDQTEVVRFLVKNGADPFLRNKAGKRPADLCQTRQVRTILRRRY